MHPPTSPIPRRYYDHDRCLGPDGYRIRTLTQSVDASALFLLHAPLKDKICNYSLYIATALCTFAGLIKLYIFNQYHPDQAFPPDVLYATTFIGITFIFMSAYYCTVLYRCSTLIDQPTVVIPSSPDPASPNNASVDLEHSGGGPASACGCLGVPQL